MNCDLRLLFYFISQVLWLCSTDVWSFRGVKIQHTNTKKNILQYVLEDSTNDKENSSDQQEQ
jgi:hypothetical protein